MSALYASQNKQAVLIGVDHQIQYSNANTGPELSSTIQTFQAYLAGIAVTLNADLIAEEFSQEAMAINAAIGCTVRDMAHSIGRPHLFCDPDNVERAAANITTPSKREDEWLTRILKENPSRLLFVCGDNHIDSFAERLRASGYVTEIDSRNWGIDCTFKN